MKGDEKWLSEAFSIIESPLEMDAVIARLRDFLEIDHLVYHSSKMGASPSVEPYIRLTYPAAWIKRYLQMGYVDVDPVVREGFLRTLPFAWSELKIVTAAEMTFPAASTAEEPVFGSTHIVARINVCVPWTSSGASDSRAGMCKPICPTSSRK